MKDTRSRNPINPTSGYSDVIINAVHKINKGRRSQKGPELGLHGLLFLMVMTFPIAKRLLLTFCFDNLQTLSWAWTPFNNVYNQDTYSRNETSSRTLSGWVNGRPVSIVWLCQLIYRNFLGTWAWGDKVRFNLRPITAWMLNSSLWPFVVARLGLSRRSRLQKPARNMESMRRTRPFILRYRRNLRLWRVWTHHRKTLEGFLWRVQEQGGHCDKVWVRLSSTKRCCRQLILMAGYK